MPNEPFALTEKREQRTCCQPVTAKGAPEPQNR